MKKILLLCFTFLFVACGSSSDSLVGDSPDPSGDSTDIGNGGDLIQCYPSSDKFPYPLSEGWYLLDYVELAFGKLKFLKINSVDEYIDHIRSIISKGAPEQLQSFNHYLSTIPFLKGYDADKDNTQIKREWQSIAKNEEINDENPSYIPRNCKVYRSKSINLHQVVVRNEYYNSNNELTRIVYSYDEMLVEKIGDKPLQISMLIFHEWLWDFYANSKNERASRLLRKANRELHSNRSLGLTDKMIRDLILFRNNFPSNGRP